MTTKTRTWTGTLQRPADVVNWDACQCTGDCTCPKVVEIPIRTADGRTIIATLTADEAEQYAARVQAAAEMARALS